MRVEVYSPKALEEVHGECVAGVPRTADEFCEDAGRQLAGWHRRGADTRAWGYT